MTHSQRLYLLFRAHALHAASERARAEGEVFRPALPFTPLGDAIEGYAQHEGGVTTLTLRHPATIECDERVAGAFHAFFDEEVQREEPHVEEGWMVHRGSATDVANPFATEPTPHVPSTSPDPPLRHPRE